MGLLDSGSGLCRYDTEHSGYHCVGKSQSGEVARVGDRAADVSDRGDRALCVFRAQHQEHAHDIATQPTAVAGADHAGGV